MQKKSGDFSLQEAMQLAQSPAGQELLALLRQADSSTLQRAMEAANSGNYKEAAQAINKVLTPQMRKLAEDLGG